VIGGRIVYGTITKPVTFSWLRCIVVTSVLLYLNGTNPANFYNTNPSNSTGTGTRTNKQKLKIKQIPKSRLQVTWEKIATWGDTMYSSTQFPSSTSLLNSSHERRRTTNYWLFNVQERTSKGVVVAVGGMDLQCHYSDEEYPIIGISLCQNIIQQYMTHRKPLWYYPNDYSYTTHRCFAWILVLTTLISFCCTNPMVCRTGYILVDSLATFIYEDSVQSPLVSLAYRLLSLNLLIYPALQAMEITVKQQSPDSLFVLSTSNNVLNYSFSLLIWIGLAILMNTASKSWTGQFTLQFHALAAVGMGYYARYQASGMAPIFDWMLEPEEVDEAWTFITWTIVLILAIRGSITTAVFWCLAHCAGQMLYQYQYDHLVLIATARSFANWMNSVSNTMHQFLFGKPHHQQHRTDYR
jgi:hypothetical protein